MGNFNFTVPALGSKFIDYRQPILGDSFNWSWVRPMSQVRYLAIHHSAGPDTQTPDDIARYHVNSLGWGGVGYHFIIDHASRVYYVGDLTTARANVLDLNHLVLGICLIGSFIDGKQPSHDQLASLHALCNQLLFHTPELPGTDGWEDVVGHKSLRATRCPGDDWPTWRAQMITINSSPSPSPPPTPTPQPSNERIQQIKELYRVILGRDPDPSGLDHHNNSSASIDQIRKAMTESQEHQQILDRANRLTLAKQAADQALASTNEVQSKTNEVKLQLEEITRL